MQIISKEYSLLFNALTDAEETLAQLRQGLLRIGQGIEQQGILFGNDLHMESILSENGTRCWM